MGNALGQGGEILALSLMVLKQKDVMFDAPGHSSERSEQQCIEPNNYVKVHLYLHVLGL